MIYVQCANTVCASFRVKLVNKTEEARLERVQRLIDKERRFNSNLQNKIIERATKSLKEKQALLQLLENDYKVDKFITMKQNFDPSTINDKANARRYIIESRVFNSGFNMKAMKPEVYRRIRKLDPNHKHKTFKKRLLASCKEQNVEINRGMNDTTFYRMLGDRKNWRELNCRDNWLNSASEHARASSGEPRDLYSGQLEGDGDEIDAVRQENAETTEPEKEKSIVLERRCKLPRPKHQAFSMTMRTLGPVYFQTSTTIQDTENVVT